MVTQFNHGWMLFPLGAIAMQSKVLSAIHPDDLTIALHRHKQGDWSELTPEERAHNEHALKEGLAIISRHTDRDSVRYSIETLVNRKSTVVRLLGK